MTGHAQLVGAWMPVLLIGFAATFALCLADYIQRDRARTRRQRQRRDYQSHVRVIRDQDDGQ